MGKERDEESGAQDHGQRFYSPWLARWLSADPARTNADQATPPDSGSNLFTAFGSNPSRSSIPTAANRRSRARQVRAFSRACGGGGVPTQSSALS